VVSAAKRHHSICGHLLGSMAARAAEAATGAALRPDGSLDTLREVRQARSRRSQAPARPVCTHCGHRRHMSFDTYCSDHRGYDSTFIYAEVIEIPHGTQQSRQAASRRQRLASQVMRRRPAQPRLPGEIVQVLAGYRIRWDVIPDRPRSPRAAGPRLAASSVPRAQPRSAQPRAGRSRRYPHQRRHEPPRPASR
jgi:hypothetical protein